MLAYCLTQCCHFLTFRTVSPMQYDTTVPFCDKMLSNKGQRLLHLERVCPFFTQMLQDYSSSYLKKMASGVLLNIFNNNSEHSDTLKEQAKYYYIWMFFKNMIKSPPVLILTTCFLLMETFICAYLSLFQINSPHVKKLTNHYQA